jgi:hypothetical protein
MVELTLLALLNRLMNWGCAPVIATRIVAADASTLRAVVSDPASQWRLVAGVSPLLRPRAQLGPTSSSRLVPVGVQLGRPDWPNGPPPPPTTACRAHPAPPDRSTADTAHQSPAHRPPPDSST